MRAVIAREPLPAADRRSLIDADVPDPAMPEGRDLLVRVEAVSVNPLDTKVRMQRYAGAKSGEGARILGWDAAGVVEAAGSEAALFRPGDAVYYAGSIVRPGSNAQKQLVDERIVGRKPATLDFAGAAALPLASITAYEAIVERLGADRDGGDAGKSLLVIAGAGGVGSMAIQIGRQLGLTVVATASRAESARWCRELGAAHVIDHRRPLADGLREIGLDEVEFVLLCAGPDRYWPQLGEIVRPQGAVCAIVANESPLDLKLLMRKCARFAWEAMFTRSIFGTPDMIEQHRLLDRVAEWADAGKVRSTATERLSPISAANLRAAHARVESGSMIGKIVLSGWPG
jgi:zinc-binding alcohol dehydrogenase family protein